MMLGGAVGPEGVQLQSLRLLSLDESAQLPLWAQKVHYEFGGTCGGAHHPHASSAVCWCVRVCWAVE